jgi:hypothetical protein
MSALPRSPGAFPMVGPLPYLTLSHADVRVAATAGPFPTESTWLHATYPDRLGAILHVGLIPSCWWGGDSCAVFGFDSAEEIPRCRSGDLLLEVRSCALPGSSAKAWWVPPSAIQRVSHRGRAISITGARQDAAHGQPPSVDGCGCDLVDIVRDQQEAWRATWL